MLLQNICLRNIADWALSWSMEEWIQSPVRASPQSYTETFPDMVHGWMTSRYVTSRLKINAVNRIIELILITCMRLRNTCVDIKFGELSSPSILNLEASNLMACIIREADRQRNPKDPLNGIC